MSDEVVWRFFFHHHTRMKEKAEKDIVEMMHGNRTFAIFHWGRVDLLDFIYCVGRFRGHVGYVTHWQFTFNDKMALNKRKLQIPGALETIRKYCDQYDEDCRSIENDIDWYTIKFSRGNHE